MDATTWQRLSAALDTALALDDGARRAWLAELAQRDPVLAGQVARGLADAGPQPGDAFDAWLAPALAAGTAADTAAAGTTAADVADSANSADAAEPVVTANVRHGLPLHTRLAGLRLGAWQLLDRIGQGGMGEVWRARRADGLYDAEAAIKLLRSDLSAAQLAGRFARERAVLARLDHPAIARLLDAGVDGGRAYLVLELVDGQSLADHVRQHTLPVAARVALLLQVAEAVDSAHARLVVHRDLKPSNVLVTAAGQVKLLDFGIAGLLTQDDVAQHGDLTRQAGRGLTLGYAAPEQITGEPIGTASDVFSLGVMLFELLAGNLPFGSRLQGRAAAERALLHDEPRRLFDTNGAAYSSYDSASPGQPPDAAKARGDLEAVAAKAMRKDPAQRYSSVRAFIDDLQRWQAHQPVTARRDDWRHRSHLWLRRNALPAGAAAVVALALLGGLAASTWQWQRAQVAARQSDQVTRYLTDLLASSQPEQHGGQWPTVLQLLERSSAELPTRFADDPDTRLRLLGVLTTTYTELNRFDRALPLAQDWVTLARARHGEGSREALLATVEQGHALQVHGNHAQSIALLEPRRAAVRQAFGDLSETNRSLQYVLAADYMHSGRLAEAERALDDGWRITAQLRPGDALARADHLNNLHVLRNRQGRARDALAVVHETEPFWRSTDPRHAKQILVLRRNQLDTQIELADYDDIEARSRALVQDMERVLGAGNELVLLQHRMLAKYLLHSGQPARAAAEYDRLLASAAAAGLAADDAMLVRPRAERLVVRARGWVGVPADNLAAARAQLAETDAAPHPLALPRIDSALVLAGVGLAQDDATLAAAALRTASSNPAAAADMAVRTARVAGELARLQGDLPRSRALLLTNLTRFARLAEPAVVPNWSAHLDLAYTQVLMGDPAAATTLATAARLRPRGVPAQHPLDAVAAYLQARRLHGSDDAAPVREALAALARAQGRTAWPAGSGLGSLGGALF